MLAVLVSRKLGIKRARRDGKTTSAPLCKRRSRDSIKERNRTINLLTRHKKAKKERLVAKSKRKVEKLLS